MTRRKSNYISHKAKQTTNQMTTTRHDESEEEKDTITNYIDFYRFHKANPTNIRLTLLKKEVLFSIAACFQPIQIIDLYM